MPAAAVIPAPIAYIKVVAVKKLVVEFRGSFWPGRSGMSGLALRIQGPCTTSWGTCLLFTGLGRGARTFTLKKSECSKQALLLEYISME